MSLTNNYKKLNKALKDKKDELKNRSRYDSAIETTVDKFSSLADELRTTMFPEQRKFWSESKARFSSALCTRRAGKTEGALREILATALSTPNANILYGTLTKDKARALIWVPLNRLVSRYGLKRAERGNIIEEDGDYKTDDTRLIMYLKNGAVIKLTGFDSSEKEIDKVLGEPYDLVILDEVQSFKGNVGDLVYKRLHITVAERRGRIKMIGTPGDIRMGFFYDVNCTDKKQKLDWELHKWSWKNNVGVSNHITTKGMKMHEIFQEELADTIRINPDYINTPEYHQEWLGEYFVDIDNLVYKFDPYLNTYEDEPIITEAILGIDLGWNDESAFVVFGWSENSQNLYELHSYKESKMDLDQVALKIIELKARYPVFNCVIDSQNAQGIQTIEARYNLGLSSADKAGKFEHIRLMNTDLRRGRIKFKEGSDWIIEASKLKKKTSAREGENGKVTEDSRSANHCCDAALYAYLECRQYWFVEKEIITDDRTRQRKLIEKEIKKRIEQQMKSVNGDKSEGFVRVRKPQNYDW